MGNRPTAEKIIIKMSDGTQIESEDFVVAIDGEQMTDAQFLYNCTALLLGQTVQMATNAYHRDMAKLPEDQQSLIHDSLQLFLDISEKEK